MKSGAAAEIGTIEHRQSDTIASTIEYNRESESIAVSSAIVSLLFFRCLAFFFSCLVFLFFRAGMRTGRVDVRVSRYSSMSNLSYFSSGALLF